MYCMLLIEDVYCMFYFYLFLVFEFIVTVLEYPYTSSKYDVMEQSFAVFNFLSFIGVSSV